MIWLCVRFPTIAIDALLDRKIVRQETQPTVTITRQKVLACNDEAKNLGIRAGMLLTQALSVYPDLVVLTQHREKEKDFLYRIATLLSDISPTIVYRYPDSVLVELHRCIQLHKNLLRILDLIEPRLFDRQCPFRLSLAHTVECAYLLTYTDMHTPQDFIDVSGKQLSLDKILQTTNTVALEVLPIKAKVRQQCQQVGFKQLGDLLAIPRIEITTRYGSELMSYLQIILGEKNEALDYFEFKPFFSSSFDYTDGIFHTQQLMQPVEKLTHELCHYLNQRHLLCQQLTWCFSYQDHEDETVNVRLSSMQNSRGNFLLNTAIKLDKMLIPSPINQVTLKVSHFDKVRKNSRDLFGNVTGGIDNQLRKTQLLDKLINRLGEQSCVKITLTHEKLPERSQQLIAISHDNKFSSHTIQPDTHYATLKPFFMLQNPAPLRVRNEIIYYRSEQLKLISHGEKFDSHWWQGDYRRTYYTAQSTKKRYYWIFRDSKHHWWLHGIYT